MHDDAAAVHEVPQWQVRITPPRVWPNATCLPPLGLAVCMVVSIFYVLPSGMPQPGDALLLGVVVAAFLIWHTVPIARDLYLALAGFLAWVIVVNLVWFCLHGALQRDIDWAFPRKTMFYLFNALILVFVVSVGFHDWPRTRAAVRYACLSALALQAVYLWFNPPVIDAELGLRSVGTFNNPNQLGYWALLVMAILGVVKERGRLDVLDLVGLACGMYALMLSLSKAALIAGAFLVVLILAFCGVGRRSMVGLVLVAGFGIAVASAAGVPVVEKLGTMGIVANLQQRLAGLGGQADDNLAERGYVRIALWPEYLVFGAGEGAFGRFKDEHGSNEFHSTLGNVFFSYGIIGLGLFTILLVAVFARAPAASWAYFVPVMLYGITHMGLRFSEFWIYLGLVYAQSRYGSRSS